MTNQRTTPSLTKTQIIVLLNAVIVGLSSFLPMDIYLPSLPHIVKALHTSTNQVQLSITLYLLGLGITQLIFGPLSDRFGRKPILLLGLCITTIGSIIIVFCYGPVQFLSGRFIEGVGAGAGMLVARTMAADILHGKQLSIIGSYVAMTFSLSPIVAPALGGLLQTYWGWRSNFIVLALFELSVLIIVIITCPETNQRKKIESTRFKIVMGNYKTLLSSRVFMGFMIGTGIIMTLNATYAVIAPFLFQNHFHLSAKTFGFISIILGIGSLMSKFINTRVVTRLGIQGSILLSYALIISAGLFLLGLHILNIASVPAIIIGILIAILSIGLMASNAMAGALSPFRHMGGTTVALYGSMQMTIGFLCGSIIAALPWHTDLTLALTYLCLGIAGLVAFIILIILKPQST